MVRIARKRRYFWPSNKIIRHYRPYMLFISLATSALTTFYSLHINEYEIGHGFVGSFHESPEGLKYARSSCRGDDDLDTYSHVEKDMLGAYEVPNLRRIHLWKSGQSGDPRIAIVTQATIERLDMLQGLCSVWPGRLVAAICVPFLASHGVVHYSAQYDGLSESKLFEIVENFYSFMEPCALDLELVAYDVSNLQDPRIGLYPVNSVRNRALALTQTRAVLLLDVDFLPSASLSKIVDINNPSLDYLIEDMESKNAIFVCPAFGHGNYHPMPNGTDYRLKDIWTLLQNKPLVAKSYQRYRIPSFYEVENPLDHGATNFSRWIAATRPYNITYEKLFEPYVILSRKQVPWYDERFVGYFRNKVSHLEHMYGLGMQYVVHNDFYVIHRPHPPSLAFQNSGPSRKSHYVRMWRLHAAVQKEIANGAFLPVTSFGENCSHEPQRPVLVPAPVALRPDNSKWVRKKQLPLNGICLDSSSLDNPHSALMSVNLSRLRQLAQDNNAIVHPSLLDYNVSNPNYIQDELWKLQNATCAGKSLTVLDVQGKYEAILPSCLKFKFVSSIKNASIPILIISSMHTLDDIQRHQHALESLKEYLSFRKIPYLYFRFSHQALGINGPIFQNTLTEIYRFGYFCTISEWIPFQSQFRDANDVANQFPFPLDWISLQNFTSGVSRYRADVSLHCF